jgi:hypothetical protein
MSSRIMTAMPTRPTDRRLCMPCRLGEAIFRLGPMGMAPRREWLWFAKTSCGAFQA